MELRASEFEPFKIRVLVSNSPLSLSYIIPFGFQSQIMGLLFLAQVPQPGEPSMGLVPLTALEGAFAAKIFLPFINHYSVGVDLSGLCLRPFCLSSHDKFSVALVIGLLFSLKVVLSDGCAVI